MHDVTHPPPPEVRPPTAGSDRLLGPGEREGLRLRAIRAELAHPDVRPLLLADLTAEQRAALPIHPRPDGQITSDLTELERGDGSTLIAWLRAAEELLGLREEAAYFAQVRRLVAARAARRHTPTTRDPLEAYLERLGDVPVIRHAFVDGRTVPLHEIFVELAVCETDLDYEHDLQSLASAPNVLVALRGRFRARERRQVSLQTFLGSRRHALKVLIGDPGSGKSTVAAHLRHRIAAGCFPGARVPFLVPLRAFAAAAGDGRVDFVDHVVEHELAVAEPAERARLAEVLRRRGRAGDVVFLLDGYDEVSTLGQRSTAIQQGIERLARHFTVVVTSRRAGFYADFGPCESYELVDLSDASIRGLVRNWFAHVAPAPPLFVEHFLQWLFARHITVALARNPFLLALLCYLNQGREVDDFLRVENRSELYRHAVSILSRDYRAKYGHPVERAHLRCAWAFGLWLFDAPAPMQLFGRVDFEAFADQTGAPPGALDETWLRTKLVSQWDGNETFNYIHLTFQEWGAAAALAALPASEAAACLRRRAHHPGWREVRRFVAGHCAALRDVRAGDARFADLIAPLVADRDLFDLSLFELAPLFAEFGRADPVEHLGFDLRRVLLERLSTFIEPAPFVRLYVELDPDFALSRAIEIIEAHLDRGAGAEDTDGTEVRDSGGIWQAVTVVGHVFHPLAADVLFDLVQRVAHDEHGEFERLHTAVFRALSLHTTERLRRRMIHAFTGTDDVMEKLHVLNLLKEMVDEDVADAIWQAATQTDDFTLKLTCMHALAHQQDARAVELADALRGAPEFGDTDGDVFIEAIEELQNLVSPVTTRLLERWLVAVAGDEFAEEMILMALHKNDLGDDPAPVMPYLEHDSEDLRAIAVAILMERVGKASLPHVIACLEDPVVLLEHKVELIYSAAECGLLGVLPHVEPLVRGIDLAAEPDLGVKAWAWYADLYLQGPTDARGLDHLGRRFVVALDADLADDDALFDSWFGSLIGGPEVLQAQVWAAIEPRFSVLPARARRAVALALIDHPWPGLSPWARAHLDDGDLDVAQAAQAVLTAIDLGGAVALRHRFPRLIDELRRRAVREDLRIFEDRYITALGETVPFAPAARDDAAH